jgi:hypothetical protein
MLLPIVSDFHPSGMMRTGTPLAITSRSGDQPSGSPGGSG